VSRDVATTHVSAEGFVMIAPRCLLAALAVSPTFLSPAAAAQLIVVEDSHCGPCIRFEASVGRDYNATPQGQKAPLRRLNIADKVPSDLANVVIRGPIRGTPTFILIDGGHEVGTFAGFGSSPSFWQRIDALLIRIN
jgi:hypothetical protein